MWLWLWLWLCLRWGGEGKDVKSHGRAEGAGGIVRLGGAGGKGRRLATVPWPWLRGSDTV